MPDLVLARTAQYLSLRSTLGDILAGIQPLAIAQRIGCGCCCNERRFALVDVFHSRAAVQGHNGYGL